jgi:hypothetical protein
MFLQWSFSIIPKFEWTDSTCKADLTVTTHRTFLVFFSMKVSFGPSSPFPNERTSDPACCITGSVAKPKILLSAPAPRSRKTEFRLWAQDSFIRYLENYLFELSNRIKIETIYKNFFINHDCLHKISLSLWSAGAAIGSGRQFNFGSSALGSGFATLITGYRHSVQTFTHKKTVTFRIYKT